MSSTAGTSMESRPGPAALEDRLLLLGGRVTNREPHEESVDLGLGERVGPLEFDGVLRREDEERPLQRAGGGSPVTWYPASPRAGRTELSEAPG